MPIYERAAGVLRVVVSVRGKPIERIVRGGRALALQVEAELRRQGVSSRPRRVRLLKNADGSYSMRTAAERTSVVYFIRAGTVGPIKIGFSADPTARLSGLRTGNISRLYLLGTVPGGRALERVLHMAFASERLEGEWFRPSKELLDLIREYFRPEAKP